MQPDTLEILVHHRQRTSKAVKTLLTRLKKLLIPCINTISWFCYNNSATNSNTVSVKVIKKKLITKIQNDDLASFVQINSSVCKSLLLQGLPSFNNSREVGFDGKWGMPVVHPSKIKENTNYSLATPCKCCTIISNISTNIEHY